MTTEPDMPESNPLGGHPAHARGDPQDTRLVSTDRVLIVAPHPDDEVLAAGGLLQHAVDRRAPVRIRYVTRGENNPWAQRAHEGRWRITAADRERWACLRQREALASLTHLGLQPDCTHSLAFSDQGLTDLVMSGNRAFVELLADEIAFWKPTLLLVPATFDAHPDHSALGVLAQFALARAAISHQRPKTLAYLIHRARGPKPPGTKRFALTPVQILQKRLAILCHRSQLRLRRRFLLEFAGATEEFHEIAGGRDT
ncbi:MAG: PIG-L deacetylase family protein, partial [Candidatus Eiseniibacteriota bacterium]